MKKKYLLIYIFTLFFLSSCLSEDLDLANSKVISSLSMIQSDITRYLTVGGKIEDFSGQLNNMSYGQSFLMDTNIQGAFQVMGFICNGKGKGTKIAKIVGNYSHRKAEKISLSNIPEKYKSENDLVFIDETLNGRLQRWDITNLGMIKSINSDGRIELVKKIDASDKDNYTSKSRDMITGQYYTDIKVDSTIDYITLLSDTSIGLILDENGTPYTNNQVIGDCTNKEIESIVK